MQKSSTIEILKLLTDTELKDFEKYISCSYLNGNSIAVKLFKEIKKYAPDYKSDFLEKEKLWAKMYPGKKYNYGIMKNMNFSLKKLIEDYLSFTNWKNTSGYEKSLLTELYKRNSGEIFLKKAYNFDSMIDKKPVKDQEYYTDKLFIQPKLGLSISNSKLFSKSIRNTKRIMLESFLLQYLLTTFGVIMDATRNKDFSGIRIKDDGSIDFRFIEHLLNYFKENNEDFTGSPLIKILYYLMLSFVDITDDEYFSKAREEFDKVVGLLRKIESKNIYNILIALCILKNSQGKHDYAKIELNLNMEMVNNNTLNDNSIELSVYRNIIKHTLNTKEYVILKDFVNKNKNKVNVRNQEGILFYSDAALRFSENNYEECLFTCSKINFKDFTEINYVNFIFKCDIRILEVMSHFELKNFERVIEAIDSFKHLLNYSPENSEMYKASFREFLNILNSLTMIKMNSSKVTLQKLKKRVEDAPKIPSKLWLTEKIEELKNHR